MALIRWQGFEFHAEPIKQLPNGNYVMRAMQHGPRFVPGTEVEVTQHEIIEMASAETPPTHAEGLAALEAAMAEERKTVPTPAELIAKAPKTVVRNPEPGDA